MKHSLEEYCREVTDKAEKFVQSEEMQRRIDHVRAFNLGRMAQRLETSRREVWLRVGWLLAGVAIGAACGWIRPI